MKVMSRRGMPRWPMIAAQPTEPMPPAAKTRPRSAALPCRSFLTRNGSSTSAGPMKQQVGDRGARERPPQPHVLADVGEAGPDVAGRPSRARLRSVRRAAGAIASSAAAETANVAALSANAQPTPTPAIRKPPSAGPASRSASGRTNWSSELACGSSEAGSTSGTIASNAGPKNAVAAPKTATSTSMCHSSSAPVSDSTAIAPIASPRATSAASIRRRRSKRSLRTPPEQQEGDRRDGHRDADQRERGRRVGERVDLPRQRDDEDAVAEERDAHPAPQEPEVPQAQRGEQADPAEAAAAVEPFVVMVHRPRLGSRPHRRRRCAGTRASRRRPSGWANRKPWPEPQPRSRSPRHCSWNSIPSATTSSCSVSPSAIDGGRRAPRSAATRRRAGTSGPS